MWHVTEVLTGIGVLVALIGPLVTAYLGARWAFHNTKHERIFDKRLEWYGRSLQAMEQLRLRCRNIQAAMDHGDLQSALNPLVELQGVAEEFMLCLAEAELYASRESVQRMRALGAELDREMSPFIPEIAAARRGKGMFGQFNIWQQMRDVREVIAKAINVLERLMFRTQLEIAADGRRVLGIEIVPNNDTATLRSDSKEE